MKMFFNFVIFLFMSRAFFNPLVRPLNQSDLILTLFFIQPHIFDMLTLSSILFFHFSNSIVLLRFVNNFIPFPSFLDHFRVHEQNGLTFCLLVIPAPSVLSNKHFLIVLFQILHFPILPE